jgi:hypothetical protein
MITASEPSWIAPFAGLSPRSFGKLLTSLRREGADAPRPGRPWLLPLEDRVLLGAAYWRTNLTLRHLALLFGVSKSAADRIIDHLGPQLPLKQRQQFRKTPCSSWTGPWYPPVTTASPSSPRTTATPPTTRSSSMPTPAWSSRTAVQSAKNYPPGKRTQPLPQAGPRPHEELEDPPRLPPQRRRRLPHHPRHRPPPRPCPGDRHARTAAMINYGTSFNQMLS